MVQSRITIRVNGGIFMFARSTTTIVAAALLACSISLANAQEKFWKHGILEAKSDSGFIAMVDKGGFAAKRGLKIELLQIKAGATLVKALIAGEIDSVDMGAAESIVASVRGTASRSSAVPGPACRKSFWQKRKSRRWPISRARTSPFPRPARCPTCCFAACCTQPMFRFRT
jgi:hypothetical protein